MIKIRTDKSFTMLAASEKPESPLERITDGYLSIDRGWRFNYVNEAALTMLGMPRERVLGRSLMDTFPGVRGSVFEHQYRLAFETMRTVRFEATFGRDNRWYAIVAHPSDNELQVFFTDITERNARHDALRQSERQLKELVENLPTGAILVDRGGRLHMNRMAEAITGYSRHRLTTPDEFFQVVGGWRAEGLRAAYRRAKESGFSTPTTVRFIRPDNQVRHVEVSAYGAEFGEVWILHDLTSRVQIQRELRRAHARVAELADLDGLTNTLNRRAFDRLIAEQAGACRTGDRHLGLLMIDVDDFKLFNDTFGHPAGDEVLRKVADILKESVKPHGRVCRYGGEEFAVVLPGANAEVAEAVAEKIRLTIEREAWADPAITVSIGIASLAGPDLSPSELVILADRALYASKAQGRNRATRLAIHVA